MKHKYVACIPYCIIAVLIALCGCEWRKPADKPAQTAANRFAPTGSDATVALDKYTGRLCRTTTNAASRPDLPLCGENADEQVEHVDADTQSWQKAELAVTCLGSQHFLPFFSMDGKAKNVVLDCTVKNSTGRSVALAVPAKVDALFRLQGGEVVRVKHVYIGSSQKEIAAGAEIQHAGLFLDHHGCQPDQSDSDCAQAELMRSSELLLTDTSSGVRYRVLVK